MIEITFMIYCFSIYFATSNKKKKKVAERTVINLVIKSVF